APAPLARINAALDRFDQALRARAEADRRVLFFDERAFFAREFGGRDARGRPAYLDRPTAGIVLRHSQGDAPWHLVVADGHAGTLWNGLWAREPVARLRRLDPSPAAISEAEVAALAAP